jgi:hypothetical protein
MRIKLSTITADLAQLARFSMHRNVYTFVHTRFNLPEGILAGSTSPIAVANLTLWAVSKQIS